MTTVALAAEAVAVAGAVSQLGELGAAAVVTPEEAAAIAAATAATAAAAGPALEAGAAAFQAGAQALANAAISNAVDLVQDPEVAAEAVAAVADRSPVAVALAAYGQALHAHPLTTKAVTGSFVYGLSDVLTQTFQARAAPAAARKPNRTGTDGWRMARFAGWGVVDALMTHVWYQVLEETMDSVLPPDLPAAGGVVARVVADQVSYGPFWFLVYFTFMAVLEGRGPASVREQLREEMVPAIVSSWGIWIPAQAFSFAVVPIEERVPFYLGVSFCYSVFLSVCYAESNERNLLRLELERLRADLATLSVRNRAAREVAALFREAERSTSSVFASLLKPSERNAAPRYVAFQLPEEGSEFASLLITVPAGMGGATLLSLLSATMTAHGVDVRKCVARTREEGQVDVMVLRLGVEETPAEGWTHLSSVVEALVDAHLARGGRPKGCQYLAHVEDLTRDLESAYETMLNEAETVKAELDGMSSGDAKRAGGSRPADVSVSLAERECGEAHVVEVRCPDRPGLLNDVSAAIKESGGKLLHANVSTEGEQALSTFAVELSADPDGLERAVQEAATSDASELLPDRKSVV